ncbi:HAD-IIB family hydrolase [Nitrospina watsonii]|uniref:sucrose-phosphate synthase n=1 Tax=Nitrospina watsonii TaxID=1323948 RepID=A0ABM9HCC4_9BACT|nr:HAD-IIB family hydrolase [Nitrospina watsonii]CAI2717891.1 Sucrose-phosphate synthase [Nitrospina watsonii]
MGQNSQGLYIMMFSIHGLIRSRNIEMGRDADTGGQVKYVIELAEELGKRPEVRRVDLFTRMIRDRKVSEEYSTPVENISEKVRIVRIPCGGGKYIRKELLWNHLDEFIDKTVKYIKREDDIPYLMHGHYADGGYVARHLASLFGVPFVFTGHSLGKSKKSKLRDDGLSDEDMNKRYQMDYRIQMEDDIIGCADLVVTSTHQEVEQQYGMYSHNTVPEYLVNPPGLDLERFFPYYAEDQENEHSKQARVAIDNELNRFFLNADKPLILALCRPDKRKNVSALIQAYGESKELQAIANLAVFLGIRKNIMDMGDNEKSVLIETLLLMDKHDLYGKLAIPKKHDFTYEVPELYRMVALRQGVFVNPALTEPFGLTLLESAACGVPIVATSDGGPVDITKNCQNGILIDVSEPDNISEAVKRILVDPELWKQYSSNGINNVRKHYTWDAHIDRYLEKVQQLKGDAHKDLYATDGNPIAVKMLSRNKMIVCDIDNTLTGDTESLQKLLTLIEPHKKAIAFGVATGRTIDSALEFLKENNVPVPEILITSVGAEIYYGNAGSPDKGWAMHLRQKWSKEKIKKLLATLPFLKPQEPETEREFKVSYYMEPKEEYLKEAHDLLTRNGCRYQMIYSHQQFLDILPQRASKGKALRYLSYKWEIPLENFLVAGDSGNDEEMMRGDPKGVVVGNYSAEMEILRGKRGVYFSKQKYAAGVIDGIHRYRFLET